RYVFLCDDIPRSRWWHLWPSKIADLDDGWRHVLAHGVSGTFWDENAALVAPQHPTLAAALLRLGHESLELRPADDPVPLEPLSLREQKRLAREALGIPSRVIVHWVIFEEAPPVWWAKRAAKDADVLREDVAALLGRRPTDDIETAEVLLTR